MNVIFADTFFFVAAINPRDSAHVRAIAFSDQFQGRLVTTEWIVIELANALAAGRNRLAFAELLNSIRTDPRVNIVPLSMELQRRGLELYARRWDKEWSLTDCVSFLVMSAAAVTDALTGDHHFEQAGFTALLKAPE